MEEVELKDKKDREKTTGRYLCGQVQFEISMRFLTNKAVSATQHLNFRP
jgi:hypothetical protein